MKKLTNTWKQQKRLLKRENKINRSKLSIVKKTSKLFDDDDSQHNFKQNICIKRKASNDGPVNPKRNHKIEELISLDKKQMDKNSFIRINRDELNQVNLRKLTEKEISTDNNKNKDEIKNNQYLSAWSLPHSVVEKYQDYGIKEMFKWQTECLLTGKVLNGGNLVYSAPTSAGKTIVAEILILKKVLEYQKKAIMVLPFVAIAREKMIYFQKLFFEVGIRVDGYMGCHSPAGGFDTVDIAICTIEKANSLVNRLLEEKRLQQIGILVIDELHMLGDSHRGYLLELLLTKILYISKKHHFNNNIQIIGMSATLPNLNTLAEWLEADLYTTDFRPVPLHELIKIGSTIYDCVTFEEIRCLNSLPVSFQNDADHTIFLSIETVINGHSVLIFCPSKVWCEKLAESIAKQIFQLGNLYNKDDATSKEFLQMGTNLRKQLNGDELSDVLEQLRRCPAGLDNTLSNTIRFGVAFHHAGLTFDERDIIEGAFRQGSIRILIATSTLSSGVNLPARRVIIRSPMFYGSVIDVLTYKQMVGRAGRKGKDTKGESLLLCKENESFQAKTLIKSNLPPVKSCLVKSDDLTLSNSVKRAVLEIIASGIASTPEEIKLYSSCTLAAVSHIENRMQNIIDNSLKYLVENEFVHLQNFEKDEMMIKEYKPTKLGQAVLASSMSPDESLRVLKELQQARKCFVLENELHLLYQIIPPVLSDQVEIKDWLHYLNLWEHISEDMRKVGELVGVEECFIARAVRGQYFKSSHHICALAIHKRFFIALALNDLIHEIPLTIVANKYNLPRGMLQSFQQNASTFAGMVTTFCNRLGWINIELLIKHFQKRLHFGIQHELCDLIRLNTLNAQRARALYDSGYESVSSLATSNINEIELILKNSVPFQSAKQEKSETEYELKKRHEAHIIWITGQKGVTEKEAAKMIIEEARQTVQLDLGIEIKDWNAHNDRTLYSVSITNEIKNLKSSNANTKVMRDDNISSFNDNDSAVLKKTQCNIDNMMIKQIGNNKENYFYSLTENSNYTSGEDIIFKFNEKNDKFNRSACKVSKIKNLNVNRNNYIKENFQIKNDKNGLKVHSNIIEVSGKSILDSQTNKLLSAVENNNNLEYSLNCKKICNQNYLTIDQSTNKNEIALDRLSSESLSQNCNLFVKPNSEELFEDFHLNSANTNSNLTENITETNILVESYELSINSNLNSNIKWYSDDTSLSFSSDKSVASNNSILQLNSNSNSIFSFDSGNICDDDIKSPTQEKENLLSNNSLQNTSCMELVAKKNICNQNLNSPNVNIIIAMSPCQEFNKLITQNEILTSTPISNISQQIKKSLMKNRNKNHQLSNCSSDSSCNDWISPTPPKTNTIKYISQPESLDEILIYHTENHNNSLHQENHVVSIDSGKAFTDEIECSEKSFESSVYHSSVLSSSEELNSYSGENFQIIDVSNNFKLFKKFLCDWKEKGKFCFCLIYEKKKQNYSPRGIGYNLQKEKFSSFKCPMTEINGFLYGRKNIVGICVCWDNNTVFHLSLLSSEIDFRLTADEKLKKLQHLLEFSEKERVGIAFDLKKQYKSLYKEYGIVLDSSSRTNWQDPKVADWLLDSRTTQKSLEEMITTNLPMSKFLDVIEENSRIRSLSFLKNTNTNNIFNSAAEAFLSFHLMDKLYKEMETLHLNKVFTEIEMPTLLILSKMELNGLGFDPIKAEQFQCILQNQLQKLTEEAHKLANHSFSLNSPQEISKVLYKELKLNLNDKLPNKSIRKAVRHQSTAKQHLLKLKSFHPLPNIILEWRKVNIALYKAVLPLLKKKTYSNFLNMARLYSHCDIFTITGRINMFEPNLQTIPKDFNIKSLYSNNKSSSDNYSHTVSLRCSFIPFKGALFLASDFSQLEIRILAHLSNDKKLINLLNNGGDIFKAIASQWKNISVDDVSDFDRQNAKQICYGMVYGVGIKTLSDQLDMEEEKASIFMEAFKVTYPGIKQYIESVISLCRKKGYVETLFGRRRYLPAINSEMVHIRAKAERQAVNTIIQGSAADLLKIAMIKINQKLEIIYPETKRPYQCQTSGNYDITKKDLEKHLHGGYLVLELHDELIYEVRKEDLESVYSVVKESMESVASLSVKLPVKIRVGCNWGDMKEWPHR